MTIVSIVDGGIGNLGSMLKMFRYIGANAHLVTTGEEVLAAERIVLPGVGAFDRGMQGLRSAELVTALREFAGSGKPLLGVCLGMQLLTDGSEEGTSSGLGIIPGTCRKIVARDRERVPHMGWNWVALEAPHTIMEDIRTPPKFYFAHSYAAHCQHPSDVIATTKFGAEKRFASMIGRENVLGVQFHPEKSHAYGAALLANFVGWQP